VARELEVLALVVADRHRVGLVEEDVARHQPRVGEQAGGDEVPLLGLVLELRHAPELPVARHGREQPGRLGVRGHVALREHRRALGVEAGGEQHRVQVERALAQVGGVVLDGDRVQVDDAEEGVPLLLRGRVLAEAADQVAEVLVAGRLDAGEDPHVRPFGRWRDRERSLSAPVARVHGLGGGGAPEERETVERGHGRLSLPVSRRDVKRRRLHWAAMAVAEPIWAPDSWRSLPAAQQPDWPDAAAVAAVRERLRQLPPLVFAGEARNLLAALGEVAAGRAFLLQAGDCVESFREVSAVAIREKLKVMLQMSAVLTYGATLPVVKVGRIAGQFAKPRSSRTEVVDGVELPTFRGHVVHSDEATPEARVPDPERMLHGYYQAASTLNLLRAFTKGGFADLTQVHTWNQEFVASSPEGRRYETIAT